MQCDVNSSHVPRRHNFAHSHCHSRRPMAHPRDEPRLPDHLQTEQQKGKLDTQPARNRRTSSEADAVMSGAGRHTPARQFTTVNPQAS